MERPSLFVSKHLHDFRIVASPTRTAHLTACSRSQYPHRQSRNNGGPRLGKKGEISRTASVHVAPLRAGYTMWKTSCLRPGNPLRQQRRRHGQASIATALSKLAVVVALECPLPATAAFDPGLLAREWRAGPFRPNAFFGLLRRIARPRPQTGQRLAASAAATPQPGKRLRGAEALAMARRWVLELCLTPKLASSGVEH